MNTLQPLFEQFLKEKQYLRNVTPKTLDWYTSAWGALTKAQKPNNPSDLTRAALGDFVIALRQRGLSPTTVNTWGKAINAFLAWLHAEGHLAERLEIARLKTEKRVLALLSTEELKRLLAFTPRTMDSWRAFALAQTLLDTGIRIDEALQLRPADVDFDNLLLKVRGKGRKERVVPFSFELRRVLFRWAKMRQKHHWPAEWVFPTRTGAKLTQRNTLRAHHILLKRVGIPKCGFHRLRHTFATSYLQNGGEVVHLSRVLGHSQLTTTMGYVHLLTSDLQKPHQQLSILNRLR